ncbi:MAG: glycosyltransferase [Saprospiraceae bacterium]|nr:glycosyltransferase [Saprospiraceae bacterium]
MKICFTSYHKYPGSLYGVASHSVHDNIVKGLVELGHDVFYHLKEAPEVALPEGVKYTPSRIKGADIYQINEGELDANLDIDVPWVRSIHCDVRIKGYPLDIKKPNWIYVSKTLAQLYGSDRFALNGIDPDEFIYSDVKSDYLFFIVGGLARAKMKGLERAFVIAEKSGIKLKIAGSSQDENEIEQFRRLCNSRNAEFCGPVYGKQKAELFAGAKAVLFPSRYNEACPLVILESLMSGTPVISTSNGACPELLNEDVGFICNNEDDYLQALEQVDSIQSKKCRAYAINNFHYLDMAKSYVSQYEYELGKCPTLNQYL